MTTRDPSAATPAPDPGATAHAEAQAVLAHHLHRQHALGLLYALLAYGSWGVFPVYFKALAGVSAVEVLAHRVTWAFPMLAALVLRERHGRDIVRALTTTRTLLTLLATTALIAVNWLVYIYSVATGRILESSLGYFINPMVNVALGVVLLRERLSWPKRIAVALAAAGVLWLTLRVGSLPWISLTLAFSFGMYGLLRKLVPVGALVGLTIETMLLFPFAVAWLAWAESSGRAVFLQRGRLTDLLLLLAGPLTAIPLLWFTGAARRLPLSTLGFLQYIAPSLQFLLAVFVYGEPLHGARLVAFGLIWAALAVFAFATLRESRGQPPENR
ncbi:MAG: EamA family transporter RarD [Acidobacteria bacterium]|nr:EamA family transporter RarD [Acidobacteriota bacterium]